MAKRELIPAKQEKAKERVKNFRRELEEYRAQFNKLKRDREEAVRKLFPTLTRPPFNPIVSFPLKLANHLNQ